MPRGSQQLGLRQRSMAVAAITCVANSDDLADAAPLLACSASYGRRPTIKQAVLNCIVGVFQATSATSLEPPPPLRSSP